MMLLLWNIYLLVQLFTKHPNKMIKNYILNGKPYLQLGYKIQDAFS